MRSSCAAARCACRPASRTPCTRRRSRRSTCSRRACSSSGSRPGWRERRAERRRLGAPRGRRAAASVGSSGSARAACTSASRSATPAAIAASAASRSPASRSIAPRGASPGRRPPRRRGCRRRLARVSRREAGARLLDRAPRGEGERARACSRLSATVLSAVAAYWACSAASAFCAPARAGPPPAAPRPRSLASASGAFCSSARSASNALGLLVEHGVGLARERDDPAVPLRGARSSVSGSASSSCCCSVNASASLDLRVVERRAEIGGGLVAVGGDGEAELLLARLDGVVGLHECAAGATAQLLDGLGRRLGGPDRGGLRPAARFRAPARARSR